MLRFKKIITAMILSSSACAVGANASIWQIDMSFDNDTASWGVGTHLNGGGYVDTNAANARSGSKSGFVYSFTGWSGIGRNVVLTNFSGRSYDQCAAGIYAKGLASYLEIIDTATWTYLRPLAHTTGTSTYTRVLSGAWVPPRKDVYLRYVAAGDSVGGFTYSYVDDAVLQCTY